MSAEDKTGSAQIAPEQTEENKVESNSADPAGSCSEPVTTPPQEHESASVTSDGGDPQKDEVQELDLEGVSLPNEQAEEPDLATDVETELAAAQKRADDNWERVLRMQADMENQRKRAQRDVENARKFALENIINDLLPVKDSLEMGIAAAKEAESDATKILEGSDLTLKMLSQAFEKYNISELDPMDQKFDPDFHQAMSMQEIEGKESNTVIGVLQKGYTLNGRLLRPALVMVAK